MPHLLSVLIAALAGFAVGAVLRLWLATLRRGATIARGWIEAPSALVAGLTVAFAAEGSRWLLAGWIGLLAVPLTAVDVRHHRLPDAITLPAIPITAAVAAVSALLPGDSGSLLRGVLAGLGVGAAFFALAWLAPKAMGRGDAKLSVTIGIALGYVSWSAVLVGVFLAFVFGSLIGLVGMVGGRLRLSSSIAFGPALLAGCWLVLAVPGVLRLVDPGAPP